MIRDDIKSFSRTWIYQTGLQFATLSVLAATFSVVLFSAVLTINLRGLLSSWGENVSISAYIKEDVTEPLLGTLRQNIEKLANVEEVSYVGGEKALEGFRAQMASYAPDLLRDTNFTNPFPSSFKIKLSEILEKEVNVTSLESMARSISAFEGIEDVSYGQSWINNYSSFVQMISAAGLVLACVLAFGSLFVIGNSVRTTVLARREEIEILELVGATSSMIRRPFVFEGFVMGSMAAVLALLINYAFFFWQKTVLTQNILLSGFGSRIEFLSPGLAFLFLLAGAGLGALGSWISVRNLNSGWSAIQKLEQRQ